MTRAHQDDYIGLRPSSLAALLFNYNAGLFPILALLIMRHASHDVLSYLSAMSITVTDSHLFSEAQNMIIEAKKGQAP